MIPTTMTAIEATGSTADDLRTVERPTPTPGPGEVLLSVAAAAVTRNELTWIEDFPGVPAHDVVGTVVGLGEGVDTAGVGDQLYGLIAFDRDGALAEYVAVRAADLAPKPEGLESTRAAAVPLGALTAWQALVDHAHVQAGQRVLVHGGAGGVGGYAVQLAAHLGAEVIATASARDLDRVRELGAAQAIDYASDFEAGVTDVDVVIDPVGGAVLTRSYGVLRKGGVVVCIADEPEHEETGGIRAVYFVVGPNGEQLGHLSSLIDDGRLRPLLARSIPLPDAADAFRPDPQHRSGKTVIVVR